MARNIEHGVDNQEIVDVGIKHVGDDGLGFPRAIEDINMGGDNGENRVISKSQPKDDNASLVDINVTYFEGVNANYNTSVDVSYNTLDSDVDSNESCHRDEITNEALWSDNEEAFEVGRQKAIMEKLTEEETMKNNKNVTKESKKNNDNDSISDKSGSFYRDSEDEGSVCSEEESENRPKEQCWFNAKVDWRDIEFFVGMRFKDSNEFREAVRHWSISEGYDIGWIQTSTYVMSAKCPRDGCK
ncbi:hypothetical protein Ancab_008774 [Ancistrocladus abbreviatus]